MRLLNWGSIYIESKRSIKFKENFERKIIEFKELIEVEV